MSTGRQHLKIQALRFKSPKMDTLLQTPCIDIQTRAELKSAPQSCQKKQKRCNRWSILQSNISVQFNRPRLFKLSQRVRKFVSGSKWQSQQQLRPMPIHISVFLLAVTPHYQYFSVKQDCQRTAAHTQQKRAFVFLFLEGCFASRVKRLSFILLATFQTEDESNQRQDLGGLRVMSV